VRRIYEVIQQLQSDESGQGLVEYVLIIALVAIGLVAAMLIFRNSIGNTFTNVTQELQAAPSTPFSAS
jgi:pilus assembly protein Flp/PilA